LARVSRFAAPARRGLHRISKALGKTGIIQNRLIQRNRLLHFGRYRRQKTPSEASCKLFEGVPFFLSFYLIKIRMASIKYRGDAQQGLIRWSVIDQCCPNYRKTGGG